MFRHSDAVLDVTVNPTQSQIFVTACESSEVSLYDMRVSNAKPTVLINTWKTRSIDTDTNSFPDSSDSFVGSFHSVHYNPVDANFIAVGNEITGASLIDVRMNRPCMRFKSWTSEEGEPKPSDFNQNVMSVRFNKFGTQLSVLAFKRRPVIHELNRAEPIYQFDHPDYTNLCTLKNCCFIGDSDQYLISGSDNFSLFIWKVPDSNSNYLNPFPSSMSEKKCRTIDEAHLILRGHRSIVNQARYNDKFHMIASSGVEKLVKIWTPYKLPGSNGGLLGKNDEYAPTRQLYKFNDIFTVSEFHHLDDSSIYDFTEALERNGFQVSLNK